MNFLPGKIPGVTALLWVALLWTQVARAAAPEYIGLNEIADDLGLDLTWNEPDRSARLSGEWVTLDFKAASRIIELNGVKVYLGDAVLFNRGKLYLSSDDWRYSLQPILMPRIFPNPPGFRKVVLDAGHGGDDPGGQNRSLGMSEKDLALIVTKMIGAKLQEEGFDVSYTRTNDTFIPLSTRPAMAKQANADIFLSIHFNAAGQTVRGVETFIYTLPGDPSSSRSTIEPEDRVRYAGNTNDPWNALLGFYLQSEIASRTGLPDRGLKRARFAVLEDLASPGALLELGFITNNSTGRLLQDPEYRERLADAVVNGVRRYRQTLVRLHQLP